MADAGAKTGEPSKPIDAWLVHDDTDAGINLDHWRALLETPGNRPGLAKITLEVYRGRKGWTPLRTLVCSDAKGERIESPTQQPVLDVERLLVGLREAVEDNHDRFRHKRYTLRLWVVRKKGGELAKGEEKNLVVDDEGDSALEDPFNVKMGEQYLKFGELQQRTIKELLGHIDALTRTSITTQLGALEHQQKAMVTYAQAQEYAATLRSQPSPEDVTQRLKTVMGGIQRPLKIFADHTGRAVSMWVASKVGGGGVGAPPSEPGEEQRKVRTLFEELTPEQKDKLRDGLGADVFADVVSLIHGTPEQWAQYREKIGQLLRANAMLLMQVLTPAQLQVLQSL